MSPEAVGPNPAVRSWPIATVAVTATSLAACAALARVFASAGWLGPVVVTVVGVHAVAWLCRRSGLGGWPAGAAGVASLWLLTAWTVVPGSLSGGLPLARAWHALAVALDQARSTYGSVAAPVRTDRGFVLLAVLGAGTAALVADWAAFRVRSTLQAAAAPVALFVVASTTGTARGRAWTTAVLVGALVVSTAVQRASVTDADEAWLAGRPVRASARPLRAGAALAAVAAVVALVVSPGSTTTDGHGVFGWRGSGPGGGSDRSVVSPVVDLQTRIQHEAGVPVFTVRSTAPSYWRLTSLDTFTGVQWEATDSYHDVVRGLPGAAPLPPGTTPVVSTFRIGQLASIWMPTALDPRSVDGGGKVSWDPVSASLLSARPTSDGLTYTITSAPRLATLSAARLATAAAPADADHARYLQLPTGFPPEVTALAHRVTAGATGEYAAALALQNYFINGPFTYSTSPPSDGYGTDALVRFLFDTRTGYCQQFAGAYAVLARAAGLPTRLAVGFATGTAVGAGEYVVTDSDAHTWPEVWFGPTVGWVPFEPTKGGGFAIPGAAAYTGPTAVRQAATPVAPAPSATTVPATPTVPHRVGSPLPVERRSAPSATPHAHGGLPVVPLAAAIVALAVTGWLALGGSVLALRHRRRRSAGARAPVDEREGAKVLAEWDVLAEAMAWWGLRRRPDETVTDFARRTGPGLCDLVDDPAAGPALAAVAGAVTEASFNPAPLRPAPASAAVAAADELQRALQRAAPLRRRLRRLGDPRVVWGRPRVGPA